MVKFQTRVLVAVFVLVDVLSTDLAWGLAYFLRFHFAPLSQGLLPPTLLRKAIVEEFVPSQRSQTAESLGHP